MRNMQKIYKQSIVENGFAMSAALSISLGTTFSVVLALTGFWAYWPAALLFSIATSGAYIRFCRSYGSDIGTLKVAGLLALNFLMLFIAVHFL